MIEYISDYELERGTPYSAGLDLKCVAVSQSEDGGAVYNLHLGTHINFQTEHDRQSYYAILVPRSSFPYKYGLQMINGIGIIDSDYQGELIMRVAGFIRSYEDRRTDLEKAEQCLGQKVAQLVIQPMADTNTPIHKVTTFRGRTQRGVDGFGSTTCKVPTTGA